MSEEEKVNGGAEQEKREESAKKEGKFSNFLKKVGQKLDDATYDSRLSYDFEKNHAKYQVFTGTGVFSPNPEIFVEEHTEGDACYVVALGENDVIKAGCLIRKCTDGARVCHITAVEPATLTVEFDGKTSERPAQKITIGPEAEKVDVIKAGDDFYRV